MRSTGTSDKREARSFEARLRKGLRSGRREAVMKAIDDAMMVRRVCTMGEILDGYLSERVVLIDPKVAARNAGSLVLVLAWARNLWGYEEGKPRRPDVGRIRKLPASVLTKELVRDYQRARVGGESVDFNVVLKEGRTINSTLMKARDVFCREAVVEKLAGLVLPDLSGFRGARLLNQEDARPEPLSKAEFDRMCVEADGFMASEDMGLKRRGMMNLMLRQSGMRVGSLRLLDATWVRKLDSGWVCDLKDVKGGTEPYAIPVTDEFAQLALGGGRDEHGKAVPLFKKGWKALWCGHNAWLAGIIGGMGVKTQKAHRLRDTAGTIAKVAYGLAAAVELLGHANARMTTRNYAKMQWDVSPRMMQELRAAKRLIPANIVTMAGVKDEVKAA